MMDLDDLPNMGPKCVKPIDIAQLASPDVLDHPPRILMLYGSVRAASYSRKSAQEGARILQVLGCEMRIFEPTGLPLPGIEGVDQDPKVLELRVLQSGESMVWSSSERHGAMSGIMSYRLIGSRWLWAGVRPTQGKTLTLMQVCGGSQSFNTVNQLRILGRWMRMVTIPNQSSIPKAFLEFDWDGRLPEGALYRRVMDVMEELVKFTWLVRGRSDYLVDRYSERVESAAAARRRVSNL